MKSMYLLFFQCQQGNETHKATTFFLDEVSVVYCLQVHMHSI